MRHPPEPDLDDEQIRALLASPLYLQEREKEVQTDHECIAVPDVTQPLTTPRPLTVGKSFRQTKTQKLLKKHGDTTSGDEDIQIGVLLETAVSVVFTAFFCVSLD